MERDNRTYKFDCRSAEPLGTQCDREMDQASGAFFEEVTRELKKATRFCFQVGEKFSDGSAAARMFFGDIGAGRHLEELDQAYRKELSRGNLAAAGHYLKRELVLSQGTKGYDSPISERLRGQLEQLKLVQQQAPVEGQGIRSVQVGQPSTSNLLNRFHNAPRAW
ncbi:MAG: hypothetical protein SFV17_13220 [Candidatus Obscuribacter sp.]|nr:hypothetical protein [Candidatus Obscuribacter sp.]